KLLYYKQTIIVKHQFEFISKLWYYLIRVVFRKRLFKSCPISSRKIVSTIFLFSKNKRFIGSGQLFKMQNSSLFKESRIVNLINEKITHTVFGKGTIIDHSDSFITLDFDDDVKKFVYRDAFSKFLTLNYEKLADSLHEVLSPRTKEQEPLTK